MDTVGQAVVGCWRLVDPAAAPHPVAQGWGATGVRRFVFVPVPRRSHRLLIRSLVHHGAALAMLSALALPCNELAAAAVRVDHRSSSLPPKISLSHAADSQTG